MLNIRKASAGSGKTHRLTGEYLKMLFSSAVSAKDGYKSILAVTFTNKATDEMKQRILEELYKLSLPEGNSPFMKELAGQKSEESVRERAKSILIAILNDYSLFNINTIDRFFQQTLRAFAREVGQYASYNVELDRDSVLLEAVETMMNSLEDNNELLDWMISLSIESIEKGEGWNTFPKLMKLGKELFSEDFKLKGREAGDTLRDKAFIGRYRQTLLKIISDFEQKSKDIGKRGMKMLSDAGLSPDDFPYKGSSGMQAFAKMAAGNTAIPGKRFFDLSQGVEKWYSKSAASSLKNRINTLYDTGMADLHNEAVGLFSDMEDYNTAKIILKDLFVLGILYDIYAHITDYCSRKNIVILSEATDFLNKIIDGSDTPFIYEKIGGRIDHYMLDEFQDTSVMQWGNFRPLIKDSLDSGNDNLIVGDVKQSIYRWRSSDWNLLNSGIDKEFDSIKFSPLNDNWRSGANIVNFNNDFFLQAGVQLQERYNSDLPSQYQTEFGTLITGIYSSVQQRIPQGKALDGGHVGVRFVEAIDEASWKENVKGGLPGTINTLLGNGYGADDIALLVRTNSEGSELAKYLLEKGFNIISEDSLFISSSKSVAKIVNTLKFINQPEDTIIKYLNKSDIAMPQEKSLYDMCEGIIRSMTDGESSEGAFIQAFLDCVTDYISLNGSDLKGFLKWWDEVGRTRSVSAPQGEDAIRILTIHKSKGLGFKVVIIPFFHETFFTNRGDYIWCTPAKEPFSKMKLIPVRLGQAMTDTIFAREYYKEKLYSYVDAINLAYVAFTRAKEELVIFAPKPDESSKVNAMSGLLYNHIAERKESPDSYDKGDWQHCEKRDVGEMGKTISDDGKVFSIEIGKRLNISLSGGDFFDGESERKRGIILHDILSRVSLVGDLETAVKRSVLEGVISVNDYQEIYSTISKMLSSVSDRHWFDGTYDHHNEVSIITPQGMGFRPDRVMISEGKVIVVDYKFGKKHLDSYVKQVRGYMGLLQGMGYDDVTGFLWYLDGIEEVEL